MKRIFSVLIATSLYANALGNESIASDTTPTDKIPKAAKISKLNKTSELIGVEIRNAENERVGELKDLMLNLAAERVIYVVLGTGGFLGLGDKLIALPPNALSPSSEETHLLLQADKESLRAAPGFQKNNWPAMADVRFTDEKAVASQNGVEVKEAAGAQPNARKSLGNDNPVPTRASDLIGTTVKSNAGDTLGHIKDAAIDLASGRIRYLTLTTGGLLGVGEKLIAIPPQTFRRSTESRTLVIDATAENIRQTAGFNNNQWPEMPDKAFAPKINEPAGSSKDPNSDGRTAWDQSNSKRDLMISQQLRRAIMADDTMSTLTRNITIITADGVITVRGTVASQEEVEKIVSFAREIAGNKVTNELKIKNEQQGEQNETNEPKKK